MLKTVGNPSTRFGDQTIVNGNLVIGTSGKGIDFSATPGTGTSELLSDYEEGTWTPTQGAGLTVVGAFSSSGTYTKIGNVVYVKGIVAGATSVASGAGSAVCAGLPFASTSNDVGVCVSASYVSTTAVRSSASTLIAVESQAAAANLVFSITYTV